jgi:hypothetical protein
METSNETRKENYQFKYVFTEDEIKEKSKQLARAIQARLELEDEKKTAASEFKAKIEAKVSESNLISNHINNGYEYLFKTCDVVLDFVTGRKTYFFEGVEVGVETMTKEDYQKQIGE